VISYPRVGNDNHYTVHIVEVPSGHERRHFDLPAGFSQIDGWDGRHLRVLLFAKSQPRGLMEHHRRAFDVLQDSLGEGADDRLLSQPFSSSPNRLLDGPGWLAEVSSGPFRDKPPFAIARERLSARLGLRRSPESRDVLERDDLRVRIFDPATGSLRYELPRRLVDPVHISPDGRLVACASDHGAVEVWESSPRRWPRPLAVGVVAGGLVFLLRLGWRSRWISQATRWAA
jgi:hypothetical protein